MDAFTLEEGEQVIHEKLSHFVEDNIKSFFHGIFILKRLTFRVNL